MENYTYIYGESQTHKAGDDNDTHFVPLEQVVGWAHVTNRSAVREDLLPEPMRIALESAREAQPDRQLTCIAFQTLIDGADVTRMGPEGELPDATTLG